MRKLPWYLTRTTSAVMLAGAMLATAQSALAITVDFNGLVPTGQAPNVDPSYSISGYTFTRVGTTEIYLLDPDYDSSNAPPDNSDFFTVEDDVATVQLTADSPPFSLHSFSAAAIYEDPAGELTVTGTRSGGGSLVAVFNLPAHTGSATWQTLSLPANWTNLTSVTFDWEHSYLGLDNIVLDEAPAAAVPTAVPTLSPFGILALCSLLGLGVLYSKRRSIL